MKRRIHCLDIWNAFMCEQACFSANGIPHCPTTATVLPSRIITWSTAKTIYNRAISKGKYKFYHDAFVCFYQYDDKFDGATGIWRKSKRALRILRHFAGVITPDYSTYQDFPEPLKLYNTYRMRAIGYWFGRNGLAVINNVRWGTPESWWYCFDGLPKHSVLAIGTVGGSPRKLVDRKRFEDGLQELVKRLVPHTLIVYGSANYPCFEKLKAQGVQVVAYPSQTAEAFQRRKSQ